MEKLKYASEISFAVIKSEELYFGLQKYFNKVLS